MIRLMAIGTICILLGGASYGQDVTSYVRTWRDLSDRDTSALGRTVLRGGGRSWSHAESPRFIYHAAQDEQLTSVVLEVEWSYDEICRRLNLPPADAIGRFFVLDSETDWVRVMRAAGRMEQGVALHVGREIYLLRADYRPSSYVDIPHELIHYRLWQAYGHRLPLWLEEGLAVHLGWDVATAYQLTRQLRLYREQPPLALTEWIPWDELMSLSDYPTDPVRLRAFYRQSGDLIAMLYSELGTESMAGMIASYSNQPVRLADALKNRQGWDAGRVEDLFDRVKIQATSKIHTTYGR